MIYAGIGSRHTPDNVCKSMENIAYHHACMRMTLRSGGARGADSAFEVGHNKANWPHSNKEIYRAEDCRPEWIVFTALYHPAWHMCEARARALHGRNAAIIMGADLKTPVDFVVCWTKDGGPTGGTGQALRIAEAHGIKIFNLYNRNAERDLWGFINA